MVRGVNKNRGAVDWRRTTSEPISSRVVSSLDFHAAGTRRAGILRYASAMRGMVTDPWRAKPEAPRAAVQAAPAPYPISAERLFGRYEHKGFTREQVWTAAHQACISDARFCYNSSPHLEQVRHFRVSTAKLQAFEGIPRTQRERLQKHLADDMVGLTCRAPERVSMTRAAGDPQVFEQHYAHTDTRGDGLNGTVWSLRAGYTLSSEVAKKDDRPINGHSLEHCANSGYISAGDTMLAFRSARCDTQQKLEKNLVGACCASLTCAGGDKERARGWRRSAEGEWEFQPVLVTAMDKSFRKHLWELIRKLFGGEWRTERTRLRALNTACKEVFPEHGRTGIYYNIEVNGQRERVFIRPPQIVNIVLSSQAERPAALRDARADNLAAAYKLGDLLSESLAARGKQDEAHLVASLVRLPWHRVASRLDDEAYVEAVGNLDTPLRLAVEWLHWVLAKRTLDGRELTRAADPGIEAILLKHLFDEANVAASVGCKSGVDRTPMLCALFSAAHAYQGEHGAAYDPLHARDDASPVTQEATLNMRRSFSRFATAWGKPVVELTRGFNGRIKWGSQPVPQQWYLPTEGNLHFSHGSPRQSPATT